MFNIDMYKKDVCIRRHVITVRVSDSVLAGLDCSKLSHAESVRNILVSADEKLILQALKYGDETPGDNVIHCGLTLNEFTNLNTLIESWGLGSMNYFSKLILNYIFR